MAALQRQKVRSCVDVSQAGRQNNGINTIVCNLPAAGLSVWPRHRPSERERETERETEGGAERQQRLTLTGKKKKRGGWP